MFEFFDSAVEWFGGVIGLDLDTTYGLSDDDLEALRIKSNLELYGTESSPYEWFSEDTAISKGYTEAISIADDVKTGLVVGSYLVPLALVGIGYLFFKGVLK